MFLLFLTLSTSFHFVSFILNSFHFLPLCFLCFLIFLSSSTAFVFLFLFFCLHILILQSLLLRDVDTFSFSRRFTPPLLLLTHFKAFTLSHLIISNRDFLLSLLHVFPTATERNDLWMYVLLRVIRYLLRQCVLF